MTNKENIRYIAKPVIDAIIDLLPPRLAQFSDPVPKVLKVLLGGPNEPDKNVP